MQISHAPPAAAETLHFLCCKHHSVKVLEVRHSILLTDIKTEHNKLAAAAAYTQIKLPRKISISSTRKEHNGHLHVVPCGHDDVQRLIMQLLRQRREQLATCSGYDLSDLRLRILREQGEQVVRCEVDENGAADRQA
jgi:hypothetical protein